jgi:pimeloyl-ACP methyl ester carboxylesterase
MSIRYALALVLLTAAWAAGCGQRNYTAQARYEKGLVIVLSGAGDMMGEVTSIQSGLNAGHVDWALEHFSWSQGGVFHDQTGVDQNRRMASRLARRIEGYEAQYPARPVYLVGVSAGTGILVWCLEDLQEGAHVTGAVLLSSSLQSHYDLGPALMHIKDRMYVFRNSPADMVLAAGVMATGSVDRGGLLAGGLYGFTAPGKPTEPTALLYKEKLVEISWGPGDVFLGNPGDHLGPTRSAFVHYRVAPLVLGKGPAGKASNVATAPPPPTSPATAASKRRDDTPPPPKRYLWEAYE